MSDNKINNSLKVVFLWDWEDNPYKTLLAKHLNSLLIQVEQRVWNSSEPPFFLPKLFTTLNFKNLNSNPIKNNKFDILHFQTLHPFILPKNANNKISSILKIILFVFQSLILKIWGVKLVWTVHEWSNKVDAKNNFSKWQGLILGYCFDGIITHCDRTKEEVELKCYLHNKSKVFVVPHGNYIDYYENTINSSECREKLGIPKENVVFLIFGYIYRYKGILETIDSFKKLNQNNITLLIAGKPCEDKLEELINNSICKFTNILFFAEDIPDNYVQIYLNACDCVIIPYKIFTTSGVALLAMSFSKACIAPYLGFFKDILNDSCSFLYDYNDVNGLFKAMQEAVEKKNKLSEMGENNLQLATQYNWELIANQTLEVYKNCLIPINKLPKT
jgi:beta-1,4-mannosyltransferase